MALSELYSDKILDIAGNAVQPGRLPAPDASARKVSRICGSVIEVDVIVADGVITGYGQEVSACALGQTSAAIVAREIVGTRVEDFRTLAQQMREMLKAEGTPPGGKWSDLAYLEPVREFPARHASTLLVFDTVVEALDKAAAKQSITSAS
ncbi:iron-sulfur cluster assembly scaffold protein [Devosia riboflavina]